jgi:hypothetical protein
MYPPCSTFGEPRRVFYACACGGRYGVRRYSRIRLTSLRACGGRYGERRCSRVRLTSFRSCLLRPVLTSTVVKYRGLTTKRQRPDARGGLLTYHHGPLWAVNPLAGLGGGSKAIKARSKGRPAHLPSRPSMGSKPAGGSGAWLQSNKGPKQGAACSRSITALYGH